MSPFANWAFEAEASAIDSWWEAKSLLACSELESQDAFFKIETATLSSGSLKLKSRAAIWSLS